MREKNNENEDEAENDGPRTNRRGEVLMSTVEMVRRGGKQPKRVKGAAGGLVLNVCMYVCALNKNATGSHRRRAAVGWQY